MGTRGGHALEDMRRTRTIDGEDELMPKAWELAVLSSYVPDY